MGIRLDVADELPDSVIELMRSSLKEGNPDRVLLGEVWEDATTKQSYGTKRQYALGKGLDTVMNYPFKNAVLGFLNGYSTAKEFAEFSAFPAVKLSAADVLCTDEPRFEP